MSYFKINKKSYEDGLDQTMYFQPIIMSNPMNSKGKTFCNVVNFNYTVDSKTSAYQKGIHTIKYLFRICDEPIINSVISECFC